jgi:hypothetical protein
MTTTKEVGMRRQTLGVFLAVAVGATLVFGVAGGAAKPGNGNGNLNPRKLANKECKTQKKELGKTALKGLYGKHAMRNCKREQRADVKDEIRNAAQECQAEQSDPNFPFESTYGTNTPNDNGDNGENKNALGKCISQKVKEQADEEESTT